MLITAAEVAALLGVSEEAVFGWARKRELPVSRVQDQYRFNRAEVLEWATARGMAVSPQLFPESPARERAEAGLEQALATGGVHADVPGATREAALREVVARLPLPDETDRELVCDFLLASEALGSTAVGEGIAIPHVRSPIVLPVPAPLVAVAHLAVPIEFAAPDGRPITTLFTVVAPNARCHLQLLSRIAAALHDEAFRATLARRAGSAELCAEARRVDEAASGRTQPRAPSPNPEGAR